MKPLTHAMILAAGFGTRLKPLTEKTPKPLLRFNGKPMIENVIGRLTAAGIRSITVNTHHLAEQLRDYFSANKFEAEINLTFEENILGTGGGIKNAATFLRGSENFLVYNVDVDSDIDLDALYSTHLKQQSLATLCVKQKESTRPLLVDKENFLAGRASGDKIFFSRDIGYEIRKAFCGVYVLSDRIFGLFPPNENFDIALFLCEMIKKGEKVFCQDVGSSHCTDLGKDTTLLS
jgi:NDP-sugar pyrophosphorylase family protein